jgi:peptide deformylase
MQKDTLRTLSISKKIVQLTNDKKKRADNALYCPCLAVKENEFNTKKLNKFIDAMHVIMRRENGIGLSANQVGRNIQIFIIESTQEQDRYSKVESVPYQVFINPKITAASNERTNFWHGCLSAQGFKRGNVATYEWINYEAFDKNGHKKTGKLNGLASIIFQHEFRHLLGGTYVDFAREFYEPEENKTTKSEKCSNSIPLLLSDYKIGDSLEEYYRIRCDIKK